MTNSRLPHPTHNPNNELSQYQQIRQVLLDLVDRLNNDDGLTNVDIAKLHFDAATDRIEALLQSERKEVVQAIREKLPVNDYIGVDQFKKIVKEMGLHPSSDDYKRLEREAVAGETTKIVLDQVLEILDGLDKPSESASVGGNQADKLSEFVVFDSILANSKDGALISLPARELRNYITYISEKNYNSGYVRARRSSAAKRNPHIITELEAIINTLKSDIKAEVQVTDLAKSDQEASNDVQ